MVRLEGFFFFRAFSLIYCEVGVYGRALQAWRMFQRGEHDKLQLCHINKEKEEKTKECHHFLCHPKHFQKCIKNVKKNAFGLNNALSKYVNTGG